MFLQPFVPWVGMMDYHYCPKLKVRPMIAMHKMGNCPITLAPPYDQHLYPYPKIFLSDINPETSKDIKFVLYHHLGPLHLYDCPNFGCNKSGRGSPSGHNCAKCLCSINPRFRIQVRQLKSITSPNVCLWRFFEKFGTTLMLVWCPMVCSLSFALGSFIFEEWESQIIFIFPS
jgi:hypothetical protein